MEIELNEIIGLFLIAAGIFDSIVLQKIILERFMGKDDEDSRKKIIITRIIINLVAYISIGFGLAFLLGFLPLGS